VNPFSGQPEPDVRAPGAEVASRLKGDMPCVQCGYNLRSLSVLDVCPECATPVRATVLAVVDPYAHVLRPIRWRRATAAGLVLWSAAALGAAIATWVQRGGDVYAALMDAQISVHPWTVLGTVLAGLSVIGSLVLIRPHAGLPARVTLAAVFGVACAVVAAIAYWRLHVRFDATHTRPFVESPFGKEPRILMRLVMGGLLAGAVLGLRPSARVLAARSLVLRMGRADRQTMLGMAGALAVAAVGDCLRLLGLHTESSIASICNTVGIMLIAVGSMLFTVGLSGLVVDCIRIARIIMHPPVALGDVVGGEVALRDGAGGGGDH